MSTAHRVAKNTMFLYGRMAITVFISLYTTRLILGALGVEDFGIFNLIGGTIAMLGFLNASMAAASQRFMSFAEGTGDKQRQKEIFNVSFFLHLGVAVIVGLALYLFGFWLFDGFLNIPTERIDAARSVYYFMILSTMFTVMSVPYDAVINARENMLLYSVVGVGESLLKLGAALIVVHTMSDKLVTYGWLMMSITILVLIIYRIYCHSHYTECTINFRRYFKKPLFKEMTSFAGWSFLTTSVDMVTFYGLGIILNLFFGAVLNAAQSVANQISGQLSIFSHNMFKALNPVIVKKEGAGDRNGMQRAVITGAKINFSINAFLFIPFILEVSYILKVWLKNVPEWSAIFCQLLLVQILLESFIIPLHSGLRAQGNIKRFSIYKSLSKIILLPIVMFLFHSNFPPYYMYLASITVTIIGLAVTMYYAHVNCQISVRSYLLNVILPCVSAFLVTFIFSLLPRLLIEQNLLRTIITFVISMLLFAIFTYKLTFNSEERQVIKSVFEKTLRRLK